MGGISYTNYKYLENFFFSAEKSLPLLFFSEKVLASSFFCSKKVLAPSGFFGENVFSPSFFFFGNVLAPSSSQPSPVPINFASSLKSADIRKEILNSVYGIWKSKKVLEMYNFVCLSCGFFEFWLFKGRKRPVF